MTASNDRRATRRPYGWRMLQLLLAVTLLTPALASLTAVPAVRADGLSDAIAEQQRLAKLIADQKAQLTQLASKQTSLASQIAATKQNLAGVRASIDEAQAEIDGLKGQLADVTIRYGGLAAQQGRLRLQLAELAAQEVAKELELDQRQRILASRLVAAYETDQTPLLQQLLTAHSLTEALSDVSYYSNLAAADKAMADQIRADRLVVAQLRQNVSLAATATDELATQVGEQKRQLDDQGAQLASAQAQLADLKTTLEAQLAAQQAAEAKLAKNKADLAAAIKANGQALDDLGNRIDEIIREQGGSGKIPSQYSGTFKWPMGGIITQEFGCTGVLSEPHIGSCAHFHQGIDIAAPCLTPVYSAAAGVVVFVGYNPYDAPPRAWLVIVAHSTSTVTWYAHMTARAPAGIYVGAQVAAGQLVGTENTTGHSSGCHLHWAVRVNGTFQNPRLFL
ncbi:MAG: peptidoglycan DD-metalloendopeptidase family protein [Candidatus Limnocylindrales bacterium]